MTNKEKYTRSKIRAFNDKQGLKLKHSMTNKEKYTRSKIRTFNDKQGKVH
jgi:hypothetical protein